MMVATLNCTILFLTAAAAAKDAFLRRRVTSNLELGFFFLDKIDFPDAIYLTSNPDLFSISQEFHSVGKLHKMFPSIFIR